MVTGAMGKVDPTGLDGAANAGLTYTVSVPGIEGQSSHSSLEISENDLEPAGPLGDRYEQVMGPYNDFLMIWTQAIKLGKNTTLSRDIDIIGINWPEWFLLMEIRGSGVEVPLVRDHPEWRWHMAVIAH